MKRVLKIFFGIIFLFIVCNMYLGLLHRVQAASVSISGGSVDVGNTITVNFSVSDNGGGFSGSVSYDSSKLEVVSSSDNGSNISFNSSTGAVAVFGANSFSVTFKGKSAGNASVSLGGVVLGNGEKLSGSSTTVIVKANTSDSPQNNSSSGNQSNNPSSDSPNSGSSSSNSGSTSSGNSDQQPAEPTPTFRDVNDTVYATKSMNVRSSWSTSSSKIGGLSKNQAVTRTGIGSNGWSRITYNGQTAYVSTALITTTKPQEDEDIPEDDSDNPEDSEIDSENNSDTENPDEENTDEEDTENDDSELLTEKTDEEIYKEIVSTVGTIPEVGKNYNIYIFLTVCLISIISIIFIFRKDISK